jgi:hypothetical protein
MECDCRRGFGLDIVFIDHCITQLVIVFNYGTIADFRTLKSFQPAVASVLVAW